MNQAKEAEELQKKADIADRKAKAAATKRQKELDKAARAHELAVKRAAAAEGRIEHCEASFSFARKIKDNSSVEGCNL